MTICHTCLSNKRINFAVAKAEGGGVNCVFDVAQDHLPHGRWSIYATPGKDNLPHGKWMIFSKPDHCFNHSNSLN